MQAGMCNQLETLQCRFLTHFEGEGGDECRFLTHFEGEGGDE
jgi:hypothetical protein